MKLTSPCGMLKEGKMGECVHIGILKLLIWLALER